MNRRSGFTIVELLIVVVVIAILAAITIVAYNGISSRANDAAITSDADTLRKKVELRHAENDEYGYGSNEPGSRGEFLEMYSIQSLDSRLIACDYDTCPEENFDKTKMYLRLYSDGMTYAYWINADNEWKNFDYYDANGDYVNTFETTSLQGPFNMGGGGDDM